MAVGLREQQLVADIGARLSTATRCALDVLAKTQAPGQPVDVDQVLLFPIRPILPRFWIRSSRQIGQSLGGDTH